MKRMMISALKITADRIAEARREAHDVQHFELRICGAERG
jgi:hypothetical protein